MFYKLYVAWTTGCVVTFAVDGDDSLCVLANIEEAADDGIGGRAAVHEEQVVVLEPGGREALGFVHLLVEPDDSCDVVFPEVREVSLWSMEGVAWGEEGREEGGR